MTDAERYLVAKYASRLAIRDLQVELLQAELQELRKSGDAHMTAWAGNMLQRLDKIADDLAVRMGEHWRR